MKQFIAKYILFIYLKFIKEDFEIYKKWSKPFIYAEWFVFSTYVWISSIIFFPIFYFYSVMEDNLKNNIKFQRELKKSHKKYFELFN